MDLVKPLLAGLAVGAFLWVVGVFHPFELTVPWESGDASTTNRAIVAIMGSQEFEFETLDWGRVTPFNYVASTGRFTGEGQPSETCSALRTALDRWGSVSERQTKNDGCSLRAVGAGPLAATIDVREVDRRQLQIEVKVQHSS